MKLITEYYRTKRSETGWNLEIFTDFQVTTELYNELYKNKLIIQMIVMTNTILIKTENNVDILDDVEKVLERYIRKHKEEFDYFEVYEDNKDNDLFDTIDKIISKFIAFFKRIVNKYK